MTTGATIFSGGEYVGLGMGAAGIDHLWGLEWDDRIAQCARASGFNTLTADVMTVDPRSLPVPDSYQFPRRAKQRRLNATEQAWLASGQWSIREQDVINEWLMTDTPLACKINGNGVPPLWYEKLISDLV